jgi:NAD(P)-dependent dehydrogenase (short-subunit alcohol dehydrogenase family)
MSQTTPKREQRHPAHHIVVTGAGTGIGRAIAVRLAEEGAVLTLVARRVALLEETANACREAGATDIGVAACDIRDRAGVDAAIDAAAAARGPIFGCIANAGIGGPNEPGEDDRFDDIVATNLTGTYSTLRAAQRNLAPGGDARHLVVIASILGRFGVPGYTGYCASKTALIGLARALAMELAPDNVQVNAVCPGWVATDMAWEGIDGMAAAMGTDREGAYAIAMQDVPLGRMSQPRHIAGLVSWLLSEDATGVTGQGLDMNNGAYMG